MSDFIDCIENELKIKIKKEFLPLQPGDVAKTHANVDALVNEINYKPETNIKNGIKEFIKWYKNNYKIK